MKTIQFASNLFPGQVAVLVLASAMAIPAVAQTDNQPQSTPPTAQPTTSSAATQNTDKEGFWGHMNPFARKKWVHKRIDPLNDRLTELDQVNAKNAADIKDVDARAQAGIQKAQSTADSANQAALAAGTQAQTASTAAQGASDHVNKLNGTVNGLDQYHQVNTVEVKFRGGSPILSKAAKADLDQLAESLTGRQGYILELEAHSPAAGASGIQSSQRLAEAVQRYMVTEHQIPVYRMHSVALGNVAVATEDDDKPAHVRTSTVSIRLMENSLAAQDAPSPHGVASNAAAER